MTDISFKPPPSQSKVSIIHKVDEFYKKVYLLSSKIAKRDRFGIYSKIETACLDLMTLVISAFFEEKSSRLALLHTARIKIEVLKRLIRIMSELNIIKSEKYIELEFNLQEISKMTNGWIKYLERKA